MKAKIAAVVVTAALTLSHAALATNFTIKNNCSGTITVYVGGATYATLGSGASTSASEGTWNGRIQDNLTPGASLSEWNLNASGTDWYDVSYVDGIDNPIGIQVSNGSCYSPNKCTSFSCPTVKNGSICESPCSAYQTAQYCCSGADNTSATCNEAGWPAPGSTWVNDIHNNCPGEYSYAYDDNVGLHTCPTGPSYTITFCPAGGSSSSGSSSSSSSSSSSTTSTSSSSSSSGGGSYGGTHSLTPECATGSRLDVIGNGTANGTKLDIYQANGTTAQSFVFSNTGVVPSGDYNFVKTGGAYCVQDAGTTSGSAVEIWSCAGTSAQAWNIVADGSPAGYFQLHPANGGSLCLDVSGAGNANGTPVQVYTCNSTNAQQWSGL